MLTTKSVAILMVASVLVSGCGHAGRPLQSSPNPELPGPSLLIVADPQIHNVFGNYLGQTSAWADRVVRVARRSPELNLLAPLALEEIVRKGHTDPRVPELTLVLGDASNVGCSSEYGAFKTTMDRAVPDGRIWLMAHGNHDTYMMGTMNGFVPGSAFPNWRPARMPTADFPTNESWWGVGGWVSPDRGRSWAGACNSLDGDEWGAPMNKGMWMRMYLDGLQPFGLNLPGPGTTTSDSVQFSLVAEPGSPLGKRNFEVHGFWLRPDFRADEPHSGALNRSYQSFMIQAIDVDEKHRLLVIDTSVCGRVAAGRFNIGFAWNNAGSQPCLGSRQLTLLRELVDTDKAIVIAGHFPLKDFQPNERALLLDMLSSRAGGWTYLSGHTHTKQALEEYHYTNVVEYNVGSTTDWPMSGTTIQLGLESADVVFHELHWASSESPALYRSSRGTQLEICRHLAAAKALAELSLESPLDVWTSPDPKSQACNVATEENWRRIAGQIAGFRTTIMQRAVSSDYRERYLAIAAAASLADRRQTGILDAFSRFVH